MKTRRGLLIAGTALTAVLAATLVFRVAGATATPSPSTVPVGTAAVVRTTLTSRQQVSGILGYGQPLTLLAPAGVSPAQFEQAQASYDAAAVQLRNARRAQPQSEQDVANAQAALSRIEGTYAAAKANASSLMDAAQGDIRAFQSGLDTTTSKLDSALGALPPYGPDARNAIGALHNALTPLANAETFSTTLVASALADYLRARNDLAIAIAHFDAARGVVADTAATSTAYTTAATAYSLVASRLGGAIDATSAPLTQAAASIAGAQGALTTANTRYDPLFDASRSDLAALVALVANEQQQAASVRSKLAQVTTHLAAVSDAIAASLAEAARSVTTVARQADQSSRAAQSSISAAQTQINTAAAQLDNASATKIVGAGTFTWLPRLGAVIERGQPLYAVDGRAVPLIYGAVPMYRQIALGAGGDDVAELEQSLVALGYAAVADAQFTADDASAVRAWQASLGLPTTGEIDLGAVVVLPGATRIARTYGTVGSQYVPGQPVLDVTETAKIVSVALDTTLQSGIKVGDVASVQLPARAQAATGKVSDVSAVAQTPSGGNNQQGPLRATVNVTIRLDDAAAGGSLDQAPVRVSITDQTRTNVLAVPVTSLIARSDGSFAVRVMRASSREVVAVVPGIFGDSGLVEVTGNLDVGDMVEIPKPL